MSADTTRPEDLRMDMGAMLGAVLSRWLRILLITIFLVGVTIAILMFVPKLYESSAGLLVEQRSSALTRAPGEQPSTQPTIPVEAMMSSQIELIKSRDTLLAVIDQENLRSEPELSGAGFSPVGFVMQLLGRKPAPQSVDETVLQNLNERLTVIRERDSAVISIIVRSENPELAARVANAIAAAHVERRAELSLSDTAVASTWLEEEITKLRAKVEEAETAVADYRVENDLFAGANNTSILDQQLTNIATQITAAQERKNAAQSRANLIRGLLDSGQPIDGVTQDVRNSVVIQQLSQSKANLQGELALRSSTLLPNHPNIKSLVAQIAEIEEQIAREGSRVADALEAEAKIEGDVEASLQSDLARLKLSVSTATRDNVTLDGLEREAKAQRDLLESYLLRYSDAISRTGSNSALPDVRVVTLAAPAVNPASPKTALVVGAVGFVALALQIGGILFGELMSGRALTERTTYREMRPARARKHAPVDEPSDEEELIDDGELVNEELEEEPSAVADLFDEPAADDAVAEEAAAEIAKAVDIAPAALAADPQPIRPTRKAVTVPSLISAKDEAERLAELETVTKAAAAAAATAAASSRAASVAANELALSNLSADIAIGRVRVVMLAGLTGSDECAAVLQSLEKDALFRGLSVCRIDAGSRRISTEPGLSDLTFDKVSFGDVVHKVRDGLAEVPWGQQQALDRKSMKPATLLEALTDIYEVVLINTGAMGTDSPATLFDSIDHRLVLVTERDPDQQKLRNAMADAIGLGVEVKQVVSPPQSAVAVA